MRTLFLATGFWFALSLSAQDLLYMQRGNPGSLLVNPAADVDARVWLSLPSINTTAQTSFAAGDVLGGDLGTLWRQFPSEAAGAIATHDMGLFSMGFKAKKSTFWLGSSLNFEGNALIDRDLVGFLLWGMKDANGDIDGGAKVKNAYTYIGASVDVTRAVGQGAVVGAGLNYAYNTDGQTAVQCPAAFLKVFANFKF